MRLAVVLAFLGLTVGPKHLPLIDELDDCIQARLASPPSPDNLGYSRIITPRSMGTHFKPVFTTQRDFIPENEAERKLLAKLEDEHLQVGFYQFGAAIAQSTPDSLSFRALKGPAVITAGTPRPAWYPLMPEATRADALPDWKQIYPLAQRAMRSFEDGGLGFETQFESWTVAARPVRATSAACRGCHQARDLIGGTLYAFRTARLAH